jgi:hypothetical protein
VKVTATRSIALTDAQTHYTEPPSKLKTSATTTRTRDIATRVESGFSEIGLATGAVEWGIEGIYLYAFVLRGKGARGRMAI